MKENLEGKSLAVVKVGEKGQIVIPKDMRDMFNIVPGDSLLVLADINHGIAIMKKEDYITFAKELFKKQNKVDEK